MSEISFLIAADRPSEDKSVELWLMVLPDEDYAEKYLVVTRQLRGDCWQTEVIDFPSRDRAEAYYEVSCEGVVDDIVAEWEKREQEQIVTEWERWETEQNS